MSALEKILELTEELSPRDQANLLEILNSRFQPSETILRDAESARTDFDSGNYKIATPAEIMREIDPRSTRSR
jgi:hypothetical protein